jgi:hypothetical protein
MLTRELKTPTQAELDNEIQKLKSTLELQEGEHRELMVGCKFYSFSYCFYLLDSKQMTSS